MKILEKIPLKKFNSWQVGGDAEFFTQPTSIAELQEALVWGRKRSFSITFLGSGSNVLISDQGIKGLVVCMRDLRFIQVTPSVDQEKILLRCGAGTGKSELVKWLLQQKHPAAQFLCGIPGTVAGGVAMNAGVSELLEVRDFSQITNSIRLVKPTGELEEIPANKLEWGYRKCEGFAGNAIAEVTLSFAKIQDSEIVTKVKEANRERLLKQPLKDPSCGSVFRNPEHSLKAAQLIENAGLKGYSVGGAQVSLKHANFIINTGTATAHDLKSCIQHVQHVVEKQSQVRLQTEVVFLGEF